MLYHWKSEYLRQYASGDIVVSADSVESAREIARTMFQRHVKEEKLFYFDPEDEECIENLAYWEQKFEEDIAVSPSVGSVLFINGSQ